MTSTSTPVARRPRRRLRVVVGVLALFGLTCAFTRFDERLVGWIAGKGSGFEVEIGAIDWGVRSLGLRDVAARLPGAADPCLEAHAVEIDVALAPPRLVAVTIDRASVVATERPDGTLDLLSLPRGEDGGGEPPPIALRHARVELRGDGPLHARLREWTAAALPRVVEIERLDVMPQERGGLRLDGVMSAPLRVHATASLVDGQLAEGRAWIEPSDALDLARLRTLVAPAIAEKLAENGLSGRLIGAARVERRGEALVPSAEVDLLGVDARPSAFPLELAALRGRAEWRDGALHVDDVRGRLGGGGVKLSVDADDLAGDWKLHVGVRVDGATLDDSMRAAARTDALGKLLLEALEPEGRFSLGVDVQTARGQATARVVVDVDVEDGASIFRGFLDPSGRRRGFPMRFERIRGLVAANEHGADFDRIVGFSRSGARAEASGRVRGDSITGSVNADELALDEAFLAAAEPETGLLLRRVVELLGLSGRFGIAARYELDAQGKFTIGLRLSPRDLVAEPPPFPIAMRFDGGAVIVEGQLLRIDGLSGTSGAADVRVDGTVGLESEDAPFDVRVQARGVAIDAALRTACRALSADRMEPLWEQLSPEGALDVELHLVRATGDPEITWEVRLSPRGASVSLGGGMRATGLEGTLVASRKGDAPWLADLDSAGGLKARALGGRLTVRGLAGGVTRAVPVEGAPPPRLLVTGEQLDVGAQLRAVLAPLAPELAQLLESHHVAGHVRAQCGLAFVAGELVPDGIDVSPDRSDREEEALGVEAAPPWLPLPLRWLDGTMHADLAARRVALESLSGRIGSALLAVDRGGFTFGASGLEASLEAEIEALPFGEWIELVFGHERRAALDMLGPLGRTRVEVRELTFRLGPGGDTLERLHVNGEIDTRGWTFYTGGALHDLTGRLQIESLDVERKLGTVADVRAQGRLTGVALQLGSIRLADLQADLLLEGGRLVVPWLSADFAGGRLFKERNRLAIELEGEMPFEGQLELGSADVSRILGDDDARMRALVGRVDVDVGFRGNGRSLLRESSVSKLEAAGTLRIQDAKLWSIPVIDTLYSKAVIPLVGMGKSADGKGEEEPPRFRRGAIDFELQGADIHLSKVELEGEPLILRGEGVLGADRLAMDFYPELRTGVGFFRDLPIVGRVVDFVLWVFERNVAAFRFQGPYASPEVIWHPVSIARTAFDLSLERPRTSPRHESAPPDRF